MEDLRFEATPRQLRGLGWYTAGNAAAALVLTVIAYLGRHAQGDVAFSTYAVWSGLAALAGAKSLLRYSRAVTECTASGIATRGLVSPTHCPWRQVTGIVPVRSKLLWWPSERTTTIRVSAASGSSFRLAAPVDGGAMRDPEFSSKLAQIAEYWSHAGGPPTGPAEHPASK